MKAKKALKRLTRVETLLTDVLDEYAGSERNLRELLGNAKETVVRAKKTVNVKKVAKVAKKPPVKAASSRRRATAKKRTAAMKRKTIGAVTAPLSKTA